LKSEPTGNDVFQVIDPKPRSFHTGA